jgi:acetylornithine deacetylase/succinyl-diaminopimelate desuccinylase-like protein
MASQFLDLCKKIISIESTPSTGNAEVALFCANLCREAGLEVTLQERTLNDLKQYNLLARPVAKKTGVEEVIFQSHLDTVEPGPLGNWTKTDSNPFQATVDGDKIFGLGTTDVKLDFLCKFEALKNLKNEKFKKPFVLVGTYGEEIGMHGAHFLMESKATNSKMAIIGEPSELQIVYANNGYMVMDFDFPFSDEERRHIHSNLDNARTQEKLFRGKAVHSSTPHLGENAILKLASYIEKMPRGIAILKAHGGSSVNTVPADANIEVDADKSISHSVGEKFVGLIRELQKLEREFRNYENKSFAPAFPTLNPGLLSTDDVGLKLVVSFRITPDIDLAMVDGWANSLTDYANSHGFKANRSRLSPPSLTDLKSDLVYGALEISKELKFPEKPITKASGTECSIYSPFGLDCIVFGPGVSIGNSHTANEYNIISQLEKAKAFYSEAVKRFCL